MNVVDPSMNHVEQLITKLNEILSSGRSIETLLRNSEAKDILDQSIYFQIVQSDEYKNRHAPEGTSVEGGPS